MFGFLVFAMVTAMNVPNNEDSLLEESKEAIRFIDEDKIYLDTSKIKFLADCIYLISDHNELFSLPSLFSSEYGVYIKRDEFNFFNSWKCHVQGCNKWNSNNNNVCQWCHTPRGQTER